MGRYWAHPGAGRLQHLGLGSVAYVFLLSLLLYLLAAGLRPKDLSYRKLLTFITLTSPPAALYAIPVDRCWDLERARSLRLWFLAAVAAWRVALYMFYLRRSGRLSAAGVVVGTLLPLIIIVVTLTVLNLERAVFNIMGGPHAPATSHDAAYAFLVMLSMLSIYGIIPVLVAYVWVSAGALRSPPSGPADKA